MKKNDIYILPTSARREYNALVQRANRRIISNMKYIQQEEIQSEQVQRSLLGKFVEPENWHGGKVAFSRSVKFEPRTITDERGIERKISGEQAYKLYLRQLEKYGGIEEPRTVEGLKEGYYKAIIKNLTTVALDNPGVLTAKGQLPANIAKKVREMSLEQMQHYFAEVDVAEDLEYLPYSGEDYNGVTREEFVQVTMQRLNTLKEIYPSKEQRAIREAFRGTQHEGKAIHELEKVMKRKTRKAPKKKNKKRKKKR